MKTIAVLGAGFVTKPAIDYFLDTCGYRVTVTSLQQSEAEKLINGRAGGTAVAWSADQADTLDQIVRDSDLVLSMIPPHMHVEVARTCLRHGKNMVTTSYISPGMEELDRECQEEGILILNEIGEDPGLDNMATRQVIDQVRADKGEVLSVTSYGAGLPAFEHNDNPFGYKFSWSPGGLISAAKSPAAYLKDGTRVEVAAQELFDHHWLVDLDGIGTFETYPNRDATKYLTSFELPPDVSLYRGLLRYTGWCNTMKHLGTLGLLSDTKVMDFSSMSYAEFMAALVNQTGSQAIEDRVASYLNLHRNSDFIKKLKWLGLFDSEPVRIKQGTRADVLLEAMMRRLSYRPFEKDMVIIYIEVLADFGSYQERRISSLVVQGEPGGDTAMSRAVALPAAIAARRIIENKITLKGVQRPTIEAIYRPVLKEMEELGYRFASTSYTTHK